MAYENNYGGYQRQNQNNGGRYQPKQSTQEVVSTTGVCFTNPQAGKFMSFNYWGRMVSIEIGAYSPDSQSTWDARKSGQVFRQVISFTALADLEEMCNEVINAIKSNGSFTPVGIRVGSKRDCIIEISNGSNIGQQDGIYLVIYKGLDNTNRTNILEVYPFGNTKYVRNYDHNSGSFTNDISKVGEFKKFKKAVMNAANAFTMAQAHSIAEIKKTDKMATFKALAAITAAMGIDMTKELMEKKTTGQSSYSKGQSGGGKSYSGGGYRQYNGYQRQNQSGGYNAPRNPSPAVQNVQQQLMDMANEPVDLNIDLANLQNVALSDFNTDT